eukprot:CAMPEP_0198226994 /NCGR_PEP_ID=MMETSP1445-20131203/107459_1 /TAXON_ID=36898 /ORGANISM="Pyramimonas sp., Strain CCMP2087" /LENGTH=301 /DNA_ID=CAMNT_0043906937 /DNA_START=234 /DNA_END=1139 /DNA_ORIENTATION=-
MDDDSEDDDLEEIIVDPTICKCGQKHGSKTSPNPRCTKDELMRLGMVLVDNTMRQYVEKIFRSKTRRELDDKNAPNEWVHIAHLYNNDEFKPGMNFQDERTVDNHGKDLLHPENIPQHTRTPAVLKDWFLKLRSKLTVWTVNYEASGQNDPEAMWNFVQSGQVQDYAVWVTLRTYHVLEHVLRTIPASAQADEGSGGPSTRDPPPKKKKRNRDSGSPARGSGTSKAPPDARDAVLLGAANYLASQMPQEPARSADPTFQKTKDDTELLLSIASNAGTTEENKDMANNYLADLMRARFRDRT